MKRCPEGNLLRGACRPRASITITFDSGTRSRREKCITMQNSHQVFIREMLDARENAQERERERESGNSCDRFRTIAVEITSSKINLISENEGMISRRHR